MRLSNLLLFALVSLPQAARALWDEGRRAEAIGVLSAEVARAPVDTTLRRTLVEWELAVHHYRAALQHLALLGADADRLRGIAYYRIDDYVQALRYLDEQDPEQALMRIDALEALQRFEESDAALARARSAAGAQLAAGARSLAGSDAPSLLAADGRRLLRERDFAKAVEAFRAALDKDPLHGEALFGLGRALVASGDREQGLQVLERHRALTPLLDEWDFARRGVDLAPRHAPNLSALGDAERALGRLDRAEAAYRSAAECANAGEVVPNALRHARLLAEDRKDLGRAIDLLRAAAERAPDARLFVRAGDLLRQAQRVPEAIAQYEKALALRPGDAEIQRRLDETRATARESAR